MSFDLLAYAAQRRYRVRNLHDGWPVPPTRPPKCGERGGASGYVGGADREGAIICHHGYVTDEGNGRIGWCLLLRTRRAMTSKLKKLRAVEATVKQEGDTELAGDAPVDRIDAALQVLVPYAKPSACGLDPSLARQMSAKRWRRPEAPRESRQERRPPRHRKRPRGEHDVSIELVRGDAMDRSIGLPPVLRFFVPGTPRSSGSKTVLPVRNRSAGKWARTRGVDQWFACWISLATGPDAAIDTIVAAIQPYVRKVPAIGRAPVARLNRAKLRRPYRSRGTKGGSRALAFRCLAVRDRCGAVVLATSTAEGPSSSKKLGLGLLSPEFEPHAPASRRWDS